MLVKKVTDIGVAVNSALDNVRSAHVDTRVDIPQEPQHVLVDALDGRTGEQ
jgi:hypothetical protein